MLLATTTMATAQVVKHERLLSFEDGQVPAYISTTGGQTAMAARWQTVPD